MTTTVSETTGQRTFRRIVREQFDAFERRERLIRIAERTERAAQLKLPLPAVSSGRDRRDGPITVPAD